MCVCVCERERGGGGGGGGGLNSEIKCCNYLLMFLLLTYSVAETSYHKFAQMSLKWSQNILKET